MFSIITVCKDCCKKLEKTIVSVLEQDYKDIEYIIIDGASKDGSLELIKSYVAKDSRIKYFSEPDEGIYDAMNKGARMASGDFYEFLNAGDTFYSNEVLSRIAEAMKKSKADIYFGDHINCFEDGTYTIQRYPQWYAYELVYWLRDCVNHQSIFANKDCFSDHTFDTFYQVGADRDWMIRMIKQHKKWKSLGFMVINYEVSNDSFSIMKDAEFKKELEYQAEKYYPVGAVFGDVMELIRRGKLSSKVLHAISRRVLYR